MMTSEGTIEVDLVEFWEWVAQHHPKGLGEVAYGIPRVNKSNNTLEIDFASSTEGSPHDWAQRPVASTQWDAIPPVVAR